MLESILFRSVRHFHASVDSRDGILEIFIYSYYSDMVVTHR